MIDTGDQATFQVAGGSVSIVPQVSVWGFVHGAQVRCVACHHRLFDVSTVGAMNARPWQRIDKVQLEKLCASRGVRPGCRRKARIDVTAVPGEPYKNGLDGPWLCACGKSLGYVESVRGRFRTTCRCGNEVRVRIDEIVSAVATNVPVPTRAAAGSANGGARDAAPL